jgi:hypothetical protein
VRASEAQRGAALRPAWWSRISGGFAWVVAACAPAEPPPEFGRAHEAAIALAERVGREIDCETSVRRYLCPLTTLDDEPAREVKEGGYLGLVVAVRASRPLEKGSGETVRAAVLRVSEGKAKVEPLTPETSDDQRKYDRAVGELAPYLRGENSKLVVTPGVGALLSRLPEELVAMVRDAQGAGYLGEHPVRLYRVAGMGEGYEVVVSVEMISGGLIVGLFPVEPLEVGAAPEEPPEPVIQGDNVEVADEPPT